MRKILLVILSGIFFLSTIGWLILLIYPDLPHQIFPFTNVELMQLSLFLMTIAFLGFVFFLLLEVISEKRATSQVNQEKSFIAQQLEEEKCKFETIFNNTTSGIALLNLDGHFIRVNQSLCELLGYNDHDMLAMNYYHLLHPNHLNSLQINIQELINNQLNVYQAEQECFRKNGDMLWVMSTLSLARDHAEKPAYFILQVQNISIQKRAEERLRHMAYHDPLTGLSNRNKLEQFINHVLASSHRHQQGFALLFLDLDRFKNINDTIGHEAGDLILQVVAERLRSTVRTTDMVARLGGDEFVLLVTDVKKTESVAIIAQKILENILKVIVVNGQEIYLTTSIGISLYPYDGQNIQTLMKNADLALYRAKEHGRNNYQFYTLEMTTRAQEKMSLQNALAHALVKNEFVLHYQPKMDINTRRITGVEALLRWKNKDYGAITPDEIISLAEETGLIIPVSEWVMLTACKQLTTWHGMGFTSLTMAINCSARQFKQTTFVDDILDVLGKTNLSPELLEIDVKEETIMEDAENTLRVLHALKHSGIKIVIDDFGTGYWSLNHLRRLSVNKIKIDKSFIRQLTIDETSSAITSAIIAMANKLNIISIAEGVETKEQYEFLTREGCTEIQGYYLTQPLPQEAITEFLRHPIPDAEVIS